MTFGCKFNFDGLDAVSLSGGRRTWRNLQTYRLGCGSDWQSTGKLREAQSATQTNSAASD